MKNHRFGPFSYGDNLKKLWGLKVPKNGQKMTNIVLHPGESSNIPQVMFYCNLSQNQSPNSLWVKRQISGANISQVTLINLLARGLRKSAFLLYYLGPKQLQKSIFS